MKINKHKCFIYFYYGLGIPIIRLVLLYVSTLSCFAQLCILYININITNYILCLISI